MVMGMSLVTPPMNYLRCITENKTFNINELHISCIFSLFLYILYYILKITFLKTCTKCNDISISS